MTESTTKPPTQFHLPFLLLLHQVQDLKRSVLAIFFCFPTYCFAFLLLFLLAYNGFTVFWVHVPFLATPLSKPIVFSPVSDVREESVRKWSSSSSSQLKLSSSVLFAINKDSSATFSKIHLPILQNSSFPATTAEKFLFHRSRRARRHKRGLRSLRSEGQVSWFQTRIKVFFAGKNSSSSSSSSSCKIRFFMTWIASLESFGDIQFSAMESLFKSHPKACLVIVSKSLDSHGGSQILKPFLTNGFRVTAVAPDFDCIFKDTHAESWYNRLKEGNVNPGEISLGQNLSNLIRLALLYKFGGIYMDADVIVLKSFSKLRNTIGAQNLDAKTGKWSRLNNALLIFDKKHPLLSKFIEEFALTFDGNKWGHNGPYLVSRVVSRVSGRPGFNFTVTPPSAFYPVDWRSIAHLFQRPRDELQSKWLVKKLEQINKESFAVHLWNKRSGKLEVEKGSIVDSIISRSCIFCNS
ncbi:lactosylceramide 4-alpha-galactosyltransferase-like [Neltuma alba]|uniref:lactosylceramide 4-alpha-galactosyltransferase-like n=1 Tax=Neltuma alba TaxID=207710 RepID=UPI0010A43950|nr:lactosylceramide 4-alpha-galactosyltransferase-like [Prosopis alba]